MKRELIFYKKRCVICGKEFETSKGKVICCSTKCSNTRNLVLKRKEFTEIKKCVVCNKEYTTHSTHSKYCTVDCRNKAYLLKKEEKKLDKKQITKECTWCKKKFETFNAKQRLCTPECRYEKQKYHQRNYNAKVREILQESKNNKKIAEYRDEKIRKSWEEISKIQEIHNLSYGKAVIFYENQLTEK